VGYCECVSALNVTGYVDNDPVGIDHKKASNSPRLVRKWVDDLKTAFDGTCVDFVNVRDLYGHIRHQC